MTNRETREVLQEQIDKYGQEYDEKGIDALNTAIKLLEQTMWIPVSERLPEKSGYYLVSTIGFEVWISSYDNNRKFWAFERDIFPSRNIYAWRPLPQPYKEEKDGKNNTDND